MNTVLGIFVIAIMVWIVWCGVCEMYHSLMDYYTWAQRRHVRARNEAQYTMLALRMRDMYEADYEYGMSMLMVDDTL